MKLTGAGNQSPTWNKQKKIKYIKQHFSTHWTSINKWCVSLRRETEMMQALNLLHLHAAESGKPAEPSVYLEPRDKWVEFTG